MSDKEVWFEYWPWGGGHRARPVHWKGWVVLIGVCLAPALFVAALGPMGLKPFGPFGLPILLVISVGGVMAVLIPLFRLKGRLRDQTTVSEGAAPTA